MSETINYAKHIGVNQLTLDWLTNNPAPEDYDVSTVEHILDYLKFKDFVSLQWASWSLLQEKTQKWDKMLQQNVATIDEEYGVDIETVLDFEDGFRWVKLLSNNSYTREGNLMSHCVASYHDRDVEIYSLRDQWNKPHCTIEKNKQIKGKGNGDIAPKYIDYVVQFLEWTGMEVRDSEMENLGYIVPEFVDYVTSPLYKGRYARKDSPIIYRDDIEVFNDIEELISSKTTKKRFLRGSLDLEGNTGDIDLSSLASVGGVLDLEGNTADLDLSSLTSVGGYVDLRNNKGDIDLSSLTSVGDWLYLRGNIADLDLSSLTSVGDWLNLEGNTGDIDLSSLTSVGGSLNLEGNKGKIKFNKNLKIK